MGLRRVTNRIGPDIRRKQRALETIPREGHAKFVEVTPIRTGNAKRSTDFSGGDTIRANYNYANRLNAGYSRQARDGMTDPTIDFIKRRVRRILGG